MCEYPLARQSTEQSEQLPFGGVEIESSAKIPARALLSAEELCFTPLGQKILDVGQYRSLSIDFDRLSLVKYLNKQSRHIKHQAFGIFHAELAFLLQ